MTATLVTPRGIPAGALLTGSVTTLGGCETIHVANNFFLFVNNLAKFTLRIRKHLLLLIKDVHYFFFGIVMSDKSA